MRGFRTALGVLGLAAAGVAGLVVFGTVSLPVEALVELAGNDYLLAVGVAAVAVAAALAVQVSRSVDGLDQARPDDPESVLSVPTPGSDFDRAVRAPPWRTGWEGGAHPADRLRPLAVRAEMEAGDGDRVAARRRVAAGEWTDDRYAAALLADGDRFPLSVAAGAALRGRSPTGYAAERTASELLDRLGGGARV